VMYTTKYKYSFGTSTLKGTTVLASQIAFIKVFLWLLLNKYKCILPRKQLYNIYVWKTNFKICLNSGNYINIAVNYKLQFYIILWTEKHEGRQR
jgi:hypothetical protein